MSRVFYIKIRHCEKCNDVEIYVFQPLFFAKSLLTARLSQKRGNLERISATKLNALTKFFLNTSRSAEFISASFML